MTFTAFAGSERIAHGDAPTVSAAIAQAQRDGRARLVVFNDETGEQTDLDPRAAAFAKPGRGRPKLGVVAREVTLLPRHWDWLATQPGGASAALRRLVEDARRESTAADDARQAQQALYRVTSVLAGNLPDFEEVSRALFAKDDVKFDALIANWPIEVRDYVHRFASAERAARPIA